MLGANFKIGPTARRLQPQLVTSRMKVSLSFRIAGRIAQLDRVRTKSSLITRSALTARTRAVLLLCAGIVSRRNIFGQVSRNAGADLRLDPGTFAAQALGLQLGDLAADPAGPFRVPFGPQTQSPSLRPWGG